MNNEVLKCIEERRSIRKYKSEMPTDEEIEKIVKAGILAPCGMHSESSIVLVVKDKETRDKLSHLNASVMGRDVDPFYGAPVVLVVLARKDAFTYIYDGTLTAGNMMLAAKSLNLGSCWIHRAKEMFETDEGKEILAHLGIEGEYEGIANIIIGYPDEEPTEKNIKDNRVYYI